MAITITRYSKGRRTCRVNFHGRTSFEIDFDKGLGDNLEVFKLMGIFNFMSDLTSHYSQKDLFTMSKALGEAVETHGHRGCPLKDALDKHFSS